MVYKQEQPVARGKKGEDTQSDSRTARTVLGLSRRWIEVFSALRKQLAHAEIFPREYSGWVQLGTNATAKHV